MVSFAGDILPLFGKLEIGCMRKHGVLLDDYAYMSDSHGDGIFGTHANARHVYARLTGQERPRMPLNGPYWDDARLQKFKDWMDGEFAA
jgi:hypothetical protein